jgi:predicted DNA-binding mobile mystery protein A
MSIDIGIYMKLLNGLALDQINRRIEAIRIGTTQTKVQPGWIRFMREALGMTLKNLGDRTNLAIPTIQQAERNEASGSITVNRLRQMAEAMDCELVYAFVPKTPIRKALENAARAKAMRLLKVADVHMGLENQRVDRSLEKRIEQLALSLLEKGDIW